MDEINVMKRVSDGNNPHILKMLGCVTTTNPMMLILQFVPHGNLKDYLRAMKAADDVRNIIYNYTFNALSATTACHAHVQSTPMLSKDLHVQTMYVCRVEISKPLVLTQLLV